MTDLELEELKKKVEEEENRRMSLTGSVDLSRIETQEDIVTLCRETTRNLYNRLQGTYNSLDMKMGLIGMGTIAVLNVLVPYLEKLKKV